ncbi:hypothetical protein GYB22_12320 [bacterium]|nr:hypothetical protein [bacterium]
MNKLISVLGILLLITLSCSKVKKKTKETINKGGETVGKSASEFFEGVSEGVEKTLECEVILSQELNNKGLQTGKYTINNDSLVGNKNQLTLYLIFNEDFKAPLTAKAYDKNGLEIGRTKLEVEGKAGDAGYFDFTFNKRTYIEVKSKILIE